MSGRRREIALVTSQDFPELTADDRRLLAPLAARGAVGIPVVWSDPSVDWTRFDVVLVRSPWDWVVRAAEFQRWLETIDRPDVRVQNPAKLMQTHLDKSYLRALSERGVTIVDTTWVARAETLDLAEWLRARGVEEGVVKPTLSGGAARTFRFDHASADDASRALHAITSSGEAMVQPFAREIETDGEVSLIFFDGEFHHAVRKRPARDDFRVQAEHGGSVVAETPPPSIVRCATEAVRALPGPTLYARVDGVVRGDSLVVMELEIVEPELFLRFHDGAAERLADVLIRSLSA